MRRLTLVLVVALLALSGCGGSSTPSGGGGAQTSTASHTHLAKTKFVLHAGLAFGAFHRYIYKPYKSGQLGGGLLKHKAAKVKAALAAAFALHEVRIALNDARSSRVLSRALAPLLALQTKLGSLKSGLRSGNTAQVEAANSDVGSVSSAGRAAGQPISDQPTPSLGG